MSAVRTRAMGSTMRMFNKSRLNKKLGCVRVADMDYMNRIVGTQMPEWLDGDMVFSRLMFHWMVGLQNKDRFVAVFPADSNKRWKQITLAMTQAPNNIVETPNFSDCIASIANLSSKTGDVQILSGNPIFYQLMATKGISCFGLLLEQDNYASNHHLARAYASLLPFVPDAVAWEISKTQNGILSSDLSNLLPEHRELCEPHIDGILKLFASTDLSNPTYSPPVFDEYTPPSVETIQNTFDGLGLGQFSFR